MLTYLLSYFIFVAYTLFLFSNLFQSFMISYEAFLLQNMLNHDFWTKCHKNSGNYLVSQVILDLLGLSYANKNGPYLKLSMCRFSCRHNSS